MCCREKGDGFMDQFLSLFQNLPIIKWTDILDIAIVAFLIFKLLPILKSTGTIKIGAMVAALLVVTWLTDALNLNTLNFILTQLLSVGLLAVVILFQPEIRRMLDHVSRMEPWKGSSKNPQDMMPVIRHTVRACEAMSQEKVGALIVFARHNRLDEYMNRGTEIDAQVSEQLIRNIFFPKAALHDGAMIIREGRVTAAACVLPLSDSARLSADLGTRHRAAVGISEASDAIVVVVSEETGAISVATNGILKRYLAPETLETLLRNELCPQQDTNQENLMERLLQRMKKPEKNQKNENDQPQMQEMEGDADEE